MNACGTPDVAAPLGVPLASPKSRGIGHRQRQSALRCQQIPVSGHKNVRFGRQGRRQHQNIICLQKGKIEFGFRFGFDVISAEEDKDLCGDALR